MHLKLSVRKVDAILEVLAVPALLPGSHVRIQLSFSMAGSHRIDRDLENLPDDWLAKPELLQVRVDGPKAGFHAFPLSHQNEKLSSESLRRSARRGG